MPARTAISETPETSNARRVFLIMSLTILAALGATALVQALAQRSAPKVARAPVAMVATPNADASGDFIQSVALSHLSTPRVFEEPVAAAPEKPAAPARTKPMVKAAAKPFDVAVLPPPRPAIAAPAPVAAVAPVQEGHRLKVEAIGLDVPVPTLTQVRKLWPTPKQIAEKAGELGEKAVSWLPLR